MERARVGTKGLRPGKRDGISLFPAASDRIHWFGFKQQLLVLAAVGLVISLVSVTVTATVYKNNLRMRVASIAEAINAQRVTSLKQAASDQAAKNDYNYLKQHLARIKAVNPDARFLYLMGRKDDGSVYFLVDSESPGSPGYSWRNQPYPEASSGLKAVFDRGLPTVEGPSRDSYGNWLTALAPVVDEQSYRMPAVIGMDVPANQYGTLLALAGGIPALLTALLAFIIVANHRVRRRHDNNAHFRAEMISIASHELRTPLTGLRWSAENMLSQKLSPKVMRHSLEIMYDSAMRLNDSIEDILSLASMDSDRSRNLTLQPADLRAMLEGIVAVQRLPAEQHNLALAFSGNWPDKLVLPCDPRRLKRVFNNLLSNAIKYSRPEGQVIVGYGRTNDGAHVIYFQDSGIGIPDDEKDKVWSGFYRASNALSQDVSGTGMGLYLSRAIIEQHGGSIWLESEKDRGTIVFVSLPETVEETPPAN